MKNVQTTISGILTILIPILTMLLKLFNGQELDTTDVGFTGTAITAGTGLWCARDAKTPETIVERTTTQETKAR